MKPLDVIKRILALHKKELEENFKVNEIGIFGSYASGRAKKASDLDVLVDFKEPISLLRLVSMENYLTELLGVKVDLIPKKDVRPELKDRILSEAVYV